MFNWILRQIMGTKHARELRRLQPMIEAISQLETSMRKLDDAALSGKTAEFRTQLERGAKIDDLLIPAFAVCREASRRSLGMRHYDVQLIGGIALHEGKIAEMKTGEGKTLVATLACYLNALEGKGVHVVTVNDYLASRDAEWMGQLYGFLGLSTGVVAPQQSDAAKRHAYQCDITYGQNNEFGFDYLRDNMKFSIYDYAQRELNFAIVDEVDSILIDEARTPLIISGPGETASEKYTRVSEIIPRLRNEAHYSLDEKNHSVTLTEEGMEFAQRVLHEKSLTEVENLYDPVNLESLHILQQSLRAYTLYKRDQHYIVTPDARVLIIDEFTGRVLPGRRWSDGLHQAIEAKEHVPIQDENITLATISFQNLFRLYRKLAGMTGTADTEATEFHRIYQLEVLVIPTNKPVSRSDYDDLVYKSEREKFKAVVAEIEAAHQRGQPVLVGTTSVEKSDAIARFLERKGVPHEVLNAKQHEREAYVIAQAGRRAAVTVATNMAGRGTDILLGGNPTMLARWDVLQNTDEATRDNPVELEKATAAAAVKHLAQCEKEKREVIDLGGLHIIGTERHEARRIDNQLRGRAGRQGDPGSSRFYLSLEDDLMRIFAGERLQTMMSSMGMEEDVPIEHRWVTKAVENAQKKVEERNFDMRKHMLEYDDVLNQQRKTVYALRRQVLTGQYRTVPTDDERKKGIEPQAIVKIADPKLRDSAVPVLEQMVDKLEVNDLQREVYVWFGHQADLRHLPAEKASRLEWLKEAVGLSLTEQRERLFDLVDEIVGTMVQRTCPAGRHFEDWDIEGLKRGYHEQFGLQASGIESHHDTQELAEKLYRDAEAVLAKKAEDFGDDNFLRLFRNFYLQDIDGQWIEHLQNMDQLRDGIGLRGYGQRDPKKEYKREGFELFLQMVQSTKASVLTKLFHVERVREEDLQQIEMQRRRQAEERQRQLQTRHPSGDRDIGMEDPETSGVADTAGDHSRRRSNAALAENIQAVSPIRRDKPKVGRNDPCWCGSGKKYKQCHYRQDTESAA